MSITALERAYERAHAFSAARDGLSIYTKRLGESFTERRLTGAAFYLGRTARNLITTAVHGANFIGATAGVPEVIHEFPAEYPTRDNSSSFLNLARAMDEKQARINLANK